MPASLRFTLPVVLLLAATPARAQSEPPARSGNGQMQLASTDAISMGVVTAGFATRGSDGDLNYPSSMLVMFGGMGYLLGGPIVHLVNREFGLVRVSIAMRLALPLIGAVIGARTATCAPEEPLCGQDEAASGFAIGVATAAVADSVLTALVKVAEAQPERVSPRSRSSTPVRLLPSLVAAPNVAMVGVGGRF